MAAVDGAFEWVKAGAAIGGRDDGGGAGCWQRDCARSSAATQKRLFCVRAAGGRNPRFPPATQTAFYVRFRPRMRTECCGRYRPNPTASLTADAGCPVALIIVYNEVATGGTQFQRIASMDGTFWINVLHASFSCVNIP